MMKLCIRAMLQCATIYGRLVPALSGNRRDRALCLGSFDWELGVSSSIPALLRFGGPVTTVVERNLNTWQPKAISLVASLVNWQKPFLDLWLTRLGQFCSGRISLAWKP